MEFRRLGDGVGYFAGATNCGLVWKGKEAVLIDSGLDESAGRKILRLLNGEGLRLVAILNTHFHADHVGGNAFLVARTGARVLAPEAEAEFIRRPLLEPSSLYGMAAPPPALRNKFLMAEPTPAVEGTGPATWEDPLEAGLKLVELPGHSPGQVGLAGPEGVLFAGDLFLSSQVLDKHGIPYNADVARHLESLERAAVWVARGEYRLIVPGHGPACDPGDALRTIEENRQRVTDLLFLITDMLAAPQPVAELVHRLAHHYARLLSTPGEYLLVQSAIHACLSYLADEGQVELVVEDNRLLWRRRAAP
ncbi:MAG: MBL fold metallo-hydrolase [Bacillota bacterium]